MSSPTASNYKSGDKIHNPTVFVHYLTIHRDAGIESNLLRQVESRPNCLLSPTPRPSTSGQAPARYSTCKNLQKPEILQTALVLISNICLPGLRILCSSRICSCQLREQVLNNLFPQFSQSTHASPPPPSSSSP